MREKETQRCLNHLAGRQPSKTSSPHTPPTASSPRAWPSSTGARTSFTPRAGKSGPSSPAGFAMRPESAAICPLWATGSPSPSAGRRRARRPPAPHEVLAHGGERPRPDDRAGRRRERRHRLPRRRPRRRPELAPARALPRAGLGERGRAGRRPDQGRPVRGRRGGAGRGRGRRDRRARARRQQRHRRRASRNSTRTSLPAARSQRSARRASASRRSSTLSRARS